MNTPILLTLNLLEDSILLNEGVLDALWLLLASYLFLDALTPALSQHSFKDMI